MNVNASEWRPTFGTDTGSGSGGEAFMLSPTTAAGEQDKASNEKASWSVPPTPPMEIREADGRGGSISAAAVRSPEMSEKMSTLEYYPTWEQATHHGAAAYQTTASAGEWTRSRSLNSNHHEMMGPSYPPPPSFLDSTHAAGLNSFDWPQMFHNVIALTEKMVTQQEEEMSGLRRSSSGGGAERSSSATALNRTPHMGTLDGEGAQGKSPGGKQKKSSRSSSSGGGGGGHATAMNWAEALKNAPTSTNYNTSSSNNATTTNNNQSKKKKTTTKKEAKEVAAKQRGTSNSNGGVNNSSTQQRSSERAAVGESSARLQQEDEEDEEEDVEEDWDEQQLHFYDNHNTNNNNNNNNDKNLPPLTVNGNRRWKKPTKAQRQRDLAQKTAFESFAKALLHATSPFTAPLRQRTKTSLPHIKLDQRFGKAGQPQSAVAQFVVAPLVTNYRPRHFHDVTPGDMLEYHYDFSHIWRALPSAYALMIGYGPTWKRFAVPYAYIACTKYREEVLSLCPNEVPNTRGEPLYEDDLFKDITDVVLAVEELEFLQHYSVLEAMRKRFNLAPMYDAFDTVFRPLENYQIELWHLDQVPSTFILKVSVAEVQPRLPIALHGDTQLWEQLPVVTREELKQRCTVWQGGGKSQGQSLAVRSTVAPVSRGEASTHASAAAAAAPVKTLKRNEEHRPPEERGGDSMTVVMIAAPIAVAVACVGLTIGVLLSSRRRTAAS